MKLLIVLPGGVDPSGEVDVIPVLLSLCETLSLSHEVYVIALNQHDELTEYRLRNFQVISLPTVRLRKVIASYQLAVRRLNYYEFEPDIIHSFWLGGTTLLGAMLGRKFKAPLLASIAGGELMNIPEIRYGGHQDLLGRLIMKASLKLANGVSCGSEFLRTITLHRCKLVPELIPLGIDTQFWSLKEPRKELEKIPEKQWNLLQLASINKVKDPWLMLEVVDRLKRRGFRFHLNWIGEDTLNGEIQLQAEKMGLHSTISFHDFKVQTELKRVLVQQDFVIQTSRYESQGIALAEACSQGVCPVGTSVGWLSDLGLGVESPRGTLANKIVEQILALADDGKSRRARIVKAQRWIQQNTAELTAKKFTTSYAKLLS